MGTPVERRLLLAHGPSAGVSLPEDTADEELRQILEGLDAEIRAAVDDVDRSLIQLALAQSPRDRLRSSSNMTRTLMRLRGARTSAGG